MKVDMWLSVCVLRVKGYSYSSVSSISSPSSLSSPYSSSSSSCSLSFPSSSSSCSSSASLSSTSSSSSSFSRVLLHGCCLHPLPPPVSTLPGPHCSYIRSEWGMLHWTTASEFNIPISGRVRGQCWWIRVLWLVCRCRRWGCPVVPFCILFHFCNQWPVVDREHQLFTTLQRAGERWHQTGIFLPLTHCNGRSGQSSDVSTYMKSENHGCQLTSPFGNAFAVFGWVC